MTPVVYRYELRNEEELVATGYLTREDVLQVGDRIEIAGRPGTVRVVEPQLGSGRVPAGRPVDPRADAGSHSSLQFAVVVTHGMLGIGR